MDEYADSAPLVCTGTKYGTKFVSFLARANLQVETPVVNVFEKRTVKGQFKQASSAIVLD